MANWNLSVALRATGSSLARELKEAATQAKALGREAKEATTRVKELGRAANTASGQIRALGRDARAAATGVRQLGSQANSARTSLSRYGDAARTANRNLTGLGTNSRDAARDLARMSSQITSAVRDLTRLADAANRASTRMNGLGDRGVLGIRRYSQETSHLRTQLTGLAGLLSGGALLMGGAELIKNGNEYQQEMNSFGAVTSASAVQMTRASAVAAQLGNDLKLPGATASDAAEAMVELAKAGFRTDQAIDSTRASLTLASAAQVNAADSAKYLGDIMDQFGLGADQASVAADTLASTANAASGDITDIYYAMKYAGPVAHGLGVNIQSAAAAVGMLGKAGILGQTAGTTLRGMFANLAAPTKQMKEGLADLGIQAWDTQGNFKGLRTVIDGLSKAQKSMTQQSFTEAVKKAFGKPAMSGAIALAHQGVDSYDNLIQAVSQTGSAATIAAAKGKGLAGAMLQLKTQAKQTGLALYDGAAPGLERLTRAATEGLSKATPKITEFFKYANDAARLFGPDIADAAHDAFGSIGKEAKGALAPFKELGGDAAATALHVLLSVGQSVLTVLHNLAAGVQPVVSALGDIADGSSGASNALDIVSTAVDAAATAVSYVSGVLGPLGHLVGGLVHDFGALPAPVQTAVAAMLLMRRVGPMVSNLSNQVGGRLTGAYSSLNRQMLVQMSQARRAGQSITTMGAAFGVLQTRVPIVGRMATSFRTASAQSAGFAGSLRGVAAAAGTGLRGAMGGLTAALGGPWGLVLTGATVGLGLLASHQQKAAQAAAEHEQQISQLSAALRESNGAVDDNVRALVTESLMSTKIKTTLDGQQRLVDVAKSAKIPMSQLVDAYTNQGTSLGELQKQLTATAKTSRTTVMDPNSGLSGTAFTKSGRAASDLSKGLGGLSGDFKKAAADAKAYNEGVKGTAQGTSAYDRLKTSVAELADKTGDADQRTRALRDALDLLSGGSVSLQAAEERVNEAITNANDALSTGVTKADGYGKALLNTNGSLSTVTKNGQSLYTTLDNIADGSANASLAAYDFAQSQGKTVPQSIAAAQREMTKGRDAAVDLGRQYGLSAAQAGKVADAMGLIPGQVSILLQTKGVDNTLSQLLAVQAQFKQLPNAKTIKVDALSADAKKKLEDLGYQIKLIPGTREYKITAPTTEARTQLDLLITKLGQTNGKNVVINADTVKAISQLEGLQSKIRTTKGKSVTINALTKTAEQQLKDLGFKVTHLKNGKVSVSVPTGGPKAAVSTIQGAINSLHGKAVQNTVTTVYKTSGGAQHDAKNPYFRAAGGPIGRYADGGLPQYIPFGGPISGPGTATSDSIPAWVSDGEYVVKAASVSKYGRDMLDRINAGRYATGGQIGRYATGGFTYTPNDPVDTLGAGSAQDRYTAALQKLTDATEKLSEATTKAQKASANKAINAADAALGLKAGTKTTAFNLTSYQKMLGAAVTANSRWESDLAKIGKKAGTDVEDTLRGMGEEGRSLVGALAQASTSQFNAIVANLKKLAPTAKAVLADYTNQLNASNKTSATFQANLAKLASMGYGDLALQLAGQGDDTAQAIAAQAAASNSAAASANSAAAANAKTLSSDELAELVQIIAAVKTSSTGIHAVAGSTGLGEDEIVTVAGKATAQIKSSLGTRSSKFLADLARAQQGLSYANGGIRAGMYATQGGLVRFAEPETHGEAYIPLGPNKRAAATAVLKDVAGRFGVGLTDMSSTRPVVIVREAGATNVTVTAVRTNATASDIGAQIGRSVRRARRGGVSARA